MQVTVESSIFNNGKDFQIDINTLAGSEKLTVNWPVR